MRPKPDEDLAEEVLALLQHLRVPTVFELTKPISLDAETVAKLCELSTKLDESEFGHVRVLKEPIDYLRLAIASFWAKDYGRAIRYCEKAKTALRGKPESLQAMILSGVAAVAAGDLKEAVGVFDDVLKLDPGNQFSILAKAEALRKRGNSNARWKCSGMRPGSSLRAPGHISG